MNKDNNSMPQIAKISWTIDLRYIMMRMKLQDIHQERELVLVAIEVGLVLLGIKSGLIFVGV